MGVGFALTAAGLGGGEAIFTVLGLTCLTVGTLMLPERAKQLITTCRLRQQGRASYAIADTELILVDADGNAVIVALDRILALGIDNGEVRLRTDSDLQNVVYAILFRRRGASAEPMALRRGPGPAATRVLPLRGHRAAGTR